MHELALAEEIVRAAVRALDGQPDRLTAMEVEVGALSGTVAGTLEFCLRQVLDQRGLAGVEGRIVFAPARLACDCGCEYETDDVFAPCPACGGYVRDVLSGKDVVLKHLEVDDEKG